ncbi:MAG: hypothetical protein ACRCXC_12320 [Legionella sp.]
MPIIDFISFTVRLSIIVFNQVTRIIAYALGNIICTIGEVWDNSIGAVFTSSARGITIACNWMDDQASALKHTFLSFIESQRGHLYHWAFAQEDLKSHITVDDAEYYYRDPRRYELIPHSNSHCLLQTLLDNGADSTPSEVKHSPMPHYSPLFKEAKIMPQQKMPSPNETISCTI